MKREHDFTEGRIFVPLMEFALPVLLALFLQAMYGAVDLLVVGQFASTADVSGVATGSMLIHTVTMVITGFAMGITILVGQKIGEKQPKQASQAIGTGICLFSVVAVVLTILLISGADIIAAWMQAPKEAFNETVLYIRICGAGTIFITAYNILGSIFRGIGDSRMPLITVAIACTINIVGDLLFVVVFKMGAAGAALATVLAQAISVLISYVIIKHRKLPFDFTKAYIRFHGQTIKRVVALGTPVALQELLVGISFIVVQSLVNAIDVYASAGIGVAEKVCAFIMLVASAYMQSMSAFVAQNIGAAKPHRARKALWYGIGTSLMAGVFMAYLSFFHGNLLASVFDHHSEVIVQAHSYLKAYAIDCTLTAFLFCFIGYFNGCGKTLFVMIQGMLAAFCVRIPVAYVMSRLANTSLFLIGLATPASTVMQIILCISMYLYMKKKELAVRVM